MSPDIAMCKGEGCERKDTCFRYLATPNEYRQSYVVANPKDCDHYWECPNKSILRRMNIQNEF